MPMKNPPHPGHSIFDVCLEPLQLSVTDGAKVLGVARHTLSRVINGQAGISPEMAIRLEKAGWSNAEHWRRLQVAFDLAQVGQREGKIRVKRYEPEELPAPPWRRSWPNHRERCRGGFLWTGNRCRRICGPRDHEALDR